MQGPLAAVEPESRVAEWRLRVHRARRRVIMVVMTVVRLKRGLGHPQRMHRVDSFSFYIPLALGEEYGRFIEEQVRHGAISFEVQQYKVRGHRPLHHFRGLWSLHHSGEVF